MPTQRNPARRHAQRHRPGNHNETLLAAERDIIATNHNESLLAGTRSGINMQHNETLLAATRGGMNSDNHNESLLAGTRGGMNRKPQRDPPRGALSDRARPRDERTRDRPSTPPGSVAAPRGRRAGRAGGRADAPVPARVPARRSWSRPGRRGTRRRLHRARGLRRQSPGRLAQRPPGGPQNAPDRASG